MSTRSARLAVAYAGVVVCLLAGAASALAATYTVTGFTDGPGTCTDDVCTDLRAAVGAAAANPPSTVSLSAGTYRLTDGEIATNMSYSGADGLTITGAGESQTVIDQNTSNNRVFDFSGGSYLLQNLEVTGGNVTGSSTNGAEGGGIYGGSAEVDLTDVLLTGNSVTGSNGADGTAGMGGAQGGAAFGGGLYDAGTTALQITDSTISYNTATGGVGGEAGTGTGHGAGEGGYESGAGLSAESMTLVGSTVYSNTGTGGEGGSSTVSGTPGGNGGTAYGGGIGSSDFLALYLVNSTVVDNAAVPGFGGSAPVTAGDQGDSEGGGIDGNVSGSLELYNDTFDGNTAKGTGSFGGNIYITGEDLTDWDFEDTVFSNGIASNDSNCEMYGIGVTVNDYGHNAESDAAPGQCDLSASDSDLIGLNPDLGLLANNGGPTLTELPQAGSPLIRAGGACTYSINNSPLAALTSDQRGDARGSTCDIGAVQLQAATAVGAVTMTGTAAVGDTLTCTAAGAFTGEGLSYTYAWLRGGVAISGQSGTTYVVEKADIGKPVGCVVTAKGTAGAPVAVDSATAIVPGPGTTVPGPGRIVWVKSARLKLGKGDKLKLTLSCTGGATGCAGKLALSAKLHGKKTSTVASAGFTVVSTKRKTLTVKLSKAAVKWVRAHDEKLTATLKLTPKTGKSVSYKVKIVG